MKLSISSSSVFGIRENGKVTFMPEFAIAQCAKAGFTRLEYNFLTGPANNKPLAGDNWQDRVLQLKDVLAENNMSVPYTHDFWFLMANAKGAEDIAHKEEQIRRSVAASAMLGCKNMVVHTQSVYDSEGYNLEKTNAYNKAFFSEIGELAAKENIRLLVENVFPIAGCIDHACFPEEMAALMQELNDPMFGICWDFGHANMAKVDHEAALEIIAPWLGLLHVDDNKATGDDHTVPGYGTVPWESVMKKLKAVGYQGDLNLNVRIFAQTSLPQQQVDALKLLHKVGTDLIQMFNEA